MVINRHRDFHSDEIFRILKPGGLFITQQVGAENDRELVKLLLPEVPELPELPFPDQYLNIVLEKLEKSGFEIIQGQEAYRPIQFFEVGALVWFAHIIEWEFPDFSVENSLDRLLELHQKIEQNGYVQGSIHRFLVIAKKRKIF